MSMIELNEDKFLEEVINYKGKVLVDFNADWCGPCRILKPALEKIAMENDEVKFVSINVDNNENLARKYNIFSIPCLIVFKDGEEINRSVGLVSREEIDKLLDK